MSNGVDKGHVTYFFEILGPLHISGTVKARNFKFGRQIGHWGCSRKKCKIWSKRAWRGHV